MLRGWLVTLCCLMAAALPSPLSVQAQHSSHRQLLASGISSGALVCPPGTAPCPCKVCSSQPGSCTCCCPAGPVCSLPPPALENGHFECKTPAMQCTGICDEGFAGFAVAECVQQQDGWKPVWTTGGRCAPIMHAVFTYDSVLTLKEESYVHVVVVAGGGGGGSSIDRIGPPGGGGGGGGVILLTKVLEPSTYTVRVGRGGPSDTSGGDSLFGSWAAIGGGAGATRDVNDAFSFGWSGGSGGGMWHDPDKKLPGMPGSGTRGQGFAGGLEAFSGDWPSGPFTSSGGGGAHGVGGSGNETTGGAGGLPYTFEVGNVRFDVGAGGGGAAQSFGAVVPGGAGGHPLAGAGATALITTYPDGYSIVAGIAVNGADAAPNSGGGGGGGAAGGYGGTGGSGIVVVTWFAL